MSRAARGRRAIPNGCRLHRSPNCERHATSAPAGWLRWCRAAGRSPPTGIHQGEHVVIGDARVSHGNEATIALLQAGGAAHRRDVQTIPVLAAIDLPAGSQPPPVPPWLRPDGTTNTLNRGFHWGDATSQNPEQTPVSRWAV